MAIIGHTGSVTVATGAMGNAKAWSLDITKELVDTTDFEANGWKKSTGTLNSWTGSITAIFDASGTAEGVLQAGLMSGDVVALVMAMGDGSGTFDTYTGNALISSQNVTNDVNGIIEATFNFEGTGALVIS